METKKCTKCKKIKDLPDFRVCNEALDGLQYRCRECQSAYDKIRYDNNNKEYFADKFRKWSRKNAEYVNEKSFQWRKNNPAKCLWSSAKQRAKVKNKPFTISFNDVVLPEFCPVLGMKLDYSKTTRERKGGPRRNSASLDCIIPKLGYVPGNVAVISLRANSIKTDANSQEILKVGKWLQEVEAGLEDLKQQEEHQLSPTHPATVEG